jgi:hypothetical protein
MRGSNIQGHRPLAFVQLSKLTLQFTLEKSRSTFGIRIFKIEFSSRRYCTLVIRHGRRK